MRQLAADYQLPALSRAGTARRCGAVFETTENLRRSLGSECVRRNGDSQEPDVRYVCRSVLEAIPAPDRRRARRTDGNGDHRGVLTLISVVCRAELTGFGAHSPTAR